ncbi:protein of unknown function [Rhodovastum atsumiense]|nr:protein of unknown function [Rhodovastum atsumiense]
MLLICVNATCMGGAQLAMGSAVHGRALNGALQSHGQTQCGVCNEFRRYRCGCIRGVAGAPWPVAGFGCA